MFEILTVIIGILLALVVAAVIVALYLYFVTRRIGRRAERAVPPAGKFVTIDGNRIHYVERGEGKPILFIHGLGGTLHHFLYPLFDKLGPGYRLIALDRAGSGWSTRADGDDGRVPGQARAIHRFIETLKLEKPLLVGHSLGGAIALQTALDYPDDVSGLALISPLTHFGGGIPEGFRDLWIPSPWKRRLIAWTVSAPRAIRNAPAVLDFVFGPQRPPDDYAVAGGAMIGLRPSHYYATSTDFVSSGRDLRRLQARYGDLAMPVGILYGDADRVLNYEQHGLAMEGKVKGLDLEIVSGIGHMTQFAVPDQTAAFIRRIAARAFAA
ncbi:MAG: alpha/beta fold hydrolase [Rhizobiaceae bacterium]